jgi:DNA-binding transcriptional LysR family regulator
VKRSQLAGETLLALSRSEYPEYHLMLDEILEALPDKPRLAEEHSSGASLLAAAEVGRGLAILPSCMSLLVGGRLVLRPLTPPPKALEVGAVHAEGKLAPAAQKFLAAARVPLRKKY